MDHVALLQLNATQFVALDRDIVISFWRIPHGVLFVTMVVTCYVATASHASLTTIVTSLA
jgi:uncharacterized membrane protein AbrB (regulator of aidB expression)